MQDVKCVCVLEYFKALHSILHVRSLKGYLFEDQVFRASQMFEVGCVAFANRYIDMRLSLTF